MSLPLCSSGVDSMAKRLKIEYVDLKVSVTAELLEKEMPRTCEAILKALPIEGIATHARYSGSEVATLISKDVRIAREKATCCVEKGDIAYVWLNRDDHYGLDDDVSEICWFYDKDAQPKMFEGPVLVNIFAKMAGDTSAFYKACANTRITGVQKIRFSLIGK